MQDAACPMSGHGLHRCQHDRRSVGPVLLLTLNVLGLACVVGERLLQDLSGASGHFAEQRVVGEG